VVKADNLELLGEALTLDAATLNHSRNDLQCYDNCSALGGKWQRRMLGADR
jgi:hypothetical protein